MAINNLKLLELLSDPDEAADLLQAFGIEPPEEKKEIKKRIHELHNQIGDKPLLTTLFEFAGNFAFMAQDIFDLCEETGTGIKGQILLSSDNGPLSSSSLDSGWAFKDSFLYESDKMERARLVREPQHPLISRLGDEIQFASNRIRNLAKDTAEAERVEGGFASFMRSDFWFQRWRIYELWIFVKVIRLLQQLGGKIKFRRVNKGAWQLKYGRDIEPVALCELGGRNLDLYYQIYEPGEDRGNMPDIAVMKRDNMPDIPVSEKEERGLFVIDPKHGKSYNLKKVEDILIRYSNHFKADLTAVVNYYPMRTYPFKLDWLQQRRLILASGVAPNSIAYRRLELNLEDILLAKEISLSTPTAERPRIKPLKKQAVRGELLYIARNAVEVDEPAGPWLMSERKGTIYFPQLESFFNAKVKSIDTSPDGEGCMVKTEDERILFCPNQKPKRIDNNEIRFYIGWNPQGTLYAAATGNIIKLWKRNKNETISIKIPEPVESYDGKMEKGRWGQVSYFSSLVTKVTSELIRANIYLNTSPRHLPFILVDKSRRWWYNFIMKKTTDYTDLHRLKKKNKKIRVIRAICGFPFFIVPGRSSHQEERR